MRIIGISENLDQNRKRSRTAVMIAEEEGLKRGGESRPMLLSQKQNPLDAKFYKDGDSFNSGVFDVWKKDTCKNAESHEFIFDVKDLNGNVHVKVIDNNGHVQWSIDLNEILISSCVSVQIIQIYHKPLSNQDIFKELQASTSGDRNESRFPTHVLAFII